MLRTHTYIYIYIYIHNHYTACTHHAWYGDYYLAGWPPRKTIRSHYVYTVWGSINKRTNEGVNIKLVVNITVKFNFLPFPIHTINRVTLRPFSLVCNSQSACDLLVQRQYAHWDEHRDAEHASSSPAVRRVLSAGQTVVVRYSSPILLCFSRVLMPIYDRLSLLQTAATDAAVLSLAASRPVRSASRRPSGCDSRAYRSDSKRSLASHPPSIAISLSRVRRCQKFVERIWRHGSRRGCMAQGGGGVGKAAGAVCVVGWLHARGRRAWRHASIVCRGMKRSRSALSPERRVRRVTPAPCNMAARNWCQT